MRIVGCLLLTALVLGLGGRAPAAPSPEAEERLSEAALARYSAPGNPERYRSLLTQMREAPETLGAPAKQVRLPVQSWPNGRAKTMVFAKEAWVTLDMQGVRARNVHVEHYREDGALAGALDAEEVLVDRTKQLAVVKGRIKGSFGPDKLSGVGALIDFETQYVKILRRARIDTGRLGKADFSARGLF